MGQAVLLVHRMLHYIENKKGVTLVEVMVAFVVLLFVMMGLLQAALLSIDHNMRNIIRDEAISIAAMRMDEARNISFDSPYLNAGTEPSDGNVQTFPACATAPPPPTGPNPGAGPYPVLVIRDLRSISDFPFGTRRFITDLNADTKEINILVRWQYRDECFSHSISTLRRR